MKSAVINGNDAAVTERDIFMENIPQIAVIIEITKEMDDPSPIAWTRQTKGILSFS